MTDGPRLPSLASVIALLYRADWTRLSLAGQVAGSDDTASSVIIRRSTDAAMPASAGTDTLRVAPGGRYRRDGALLSAGSDGTRAWQLSPGPDAEDAGGPPFATLLCPSWLLTGYSLAVQDRVTACGREAIRITGTARRAGRARPAESRLPGRSALGSWYDRVEAVIDAELGILLRCELADGPADGRPGSQLVEFTSLELDPVTDDALVAPPPGSRSWDVTSAGHDLVAAPSALAFLATYFPWLASPGMPRPRGRKRAARPRAARSQPEAAEPMPDDGPPFGAGAASVSEDVLALLYRSGTEIPRFTASAHFWANGAGIIAGMDSLPGTLARDADTTTHQVSKARIDGWYRYRIERVAGQDEQAARSSGPSLRAGNEEKYWEVRADRVSIDGPRPAPAELADFADASWLLGCELWGGLPVTVNGRSAYRLSVRGRQAQSDLLTLGLPAVAAVDAETGRLLWLTCYGRGKPALRWELRDVTEAGAGPDAVAGDGDFEFTVPAGLRIARAGTDDDRPASPLRGRR